MLTVKSSSVLPGYCSMETALEVPDYPYGFRLRTSIFYWIETNGPKGDRVGTYTIDPKSGRKNKPKYSTYNPFMWLYKNEDGHVKSSALGSYDSEIFVERFKYILANIGEDFISEQQKQNLRENHIMHIAGNAPWEFPKYSEAMKPVFKQWVVDTVKHIRTCKFADLVNYSEKPVKDNPEGSVKFTISNSQTV